MVRAELVEAVLGLSRRRVHDAGVVHEAMEGAVLAEKALESFREIGRFLAARAAELSAEQCAQLLYDAVCLVAGLYPFASPSERSARVVAAPEFALLRRDLSRDLERLLVAVARDLVAGGQRSTAARRAGRARERGVSP